MNDCSLCGEEITSYDLTHDNVYEMAPYVDGDGVEYKNVTHVDCND